MVYKKYIKKNGKFYGPYIYNSRRVDGKVISEYQGVDKKDNKRFVFLILGILFLVALTFFVFNSKGKISGNVVANNQISTQTENSLESQTIVYPNIYFTLVSTQNQVSNESSVSETPQENTTAETNSTTAVENSTTSEDNSSVQENQTSSEQSSENSTTQTDSENTTTTETQQPVTTSEPTTPETTSTNETSSSPITGNVISGILKTVSNFFLGFIKPTGMAVSEQKITGEINGEVSANNQFSYTLKDGESVQLLSGSVKTNSKSLNDNVIQITYQGNTVLVSTNYSELIQSNATESNSTSVQVDFSVQQLTDAEKEILNNQFGNYSIQTTKSELFNGRYVLGYQLGDYTIEYSYDSNLDNATLKNQIENDKTKWLRDIATKLSSTEAAVENYSLPSA
jgi:hypothetical protein